MNICSQTTVGMSLFEHLDRIKRLHDFITGQKTGSAEKIAKELNVHRNTILNDLEWLRTKGAEIYYCREKNSYCYANDFILIF